jgi:hypothetical protein
MVGRSDAQPQLNLTLLRSERQIPEAQRWFGLSWSELHLEEMMRPDAGDLFTHLNKDDRMATLRFVISDSGYFLQIRWLDAFLYKEAAQQ